MSLARNLIRLRAPGIPQIIPVLAIVMEVLWAHAWLVWISSWPTWGWERPPVTLAGSILLAAYTEIIARLSLLRNWSLTRTTLVVLPSSLILLAILILWNLGGSYNFWNAEWLKNVTSHLSFVIGGLIFGIYLIWRGISVSHLRCSFDSIYFKFIIGLAAMVILLVTWGIASGVSAIWSSLALYIVLFFGIGLLALAIVNIENLREHFLKEKQDFRNFSRRWLSMLLTLITAIMAFSFALASVFSANIWGTIIHGLSILGNWLLIALSYILIPAGYLLEGLIYLFRVLVNWLRGDQLPTQFNPPDLSDLQKAAQGQPPAQIPPEVILALKWGGLAILIGLVMFMLIRALTHYWDNKREKEVDEEHETLLSWSVLKNDLQILLAWLSKLIKKTQSSTKKTLSPISAPFTRKENDLMPLNARELYQALLWQGRLSGLPREKSETPEEYRHKLESRIPTTKDEVDNITEAYMFERYGEKQTDPGKMAWLNHYWLRLKSKLIDIKTGSG